MCNIKMAEDKYLSACVYNLFLLLAYLYGVLSTCRPPGEFAELSMCAEASQTGRAFFINVTAVPQYSPAVCKCSVNISQSASDIQLSYTYQGPTSPCSSGYQFSLSNISLTCNVTTTSVGNFDEISFVKNTSDQIDYTCLILYIDRGVPENETNATASVSCFENSLDSTTISGITDMSPSITATDSHVITSTDLSGDSSSGSVQDSSIGSSPLTTQSGPVTTEKEVVFKEFIIIAIVAGVAGVLLIIVLIAIIISCCRHQHTKATYDVKRKELNAESPSADSEMTEHAFYNMALVNNPTYY